MNKIELKLILLFLLSIIIVSPVSGAPDQPHRVFGEVTDQSGNPVEIKGSFNYRGENIESFETDSEGNYDVYVPDESYGEELDILIEGQNKDSLEFEPLGVSEKDFKYTQEKDEEPSEDNTDSEPENDGGGFSGVPSTGNTENKTEESDSPQESKKNKNKSINKTENNLNKNISDNSTVSVQKHVNNVSKGSKITISMENPTEDEGTNTDQASEDSGGTPSKDSANSIKSVSFTSNSDDSEANVSVTESKNLSSEMRENVSSEPEGEVYSYTEVETDIDAVNATFEFEISESELSRRNASPDQIVQQRYNGTEWNPLETEHMEKVNGTHEFQAFSPEGFSIFATTIKEDDRNKVIEKSKPGFIRPVILSVVVIGLIYLGIFKRDGLKQTLQKLQEKLQRIYQ